MRALPHRQAGPLFPALALLLIAALGLVGVAYSAGDLSSGFSNQGSIVNTRHNMTQSSLSPPEGLHGAGAAAMDTLRNDYVEVCVYCHTPHAANATTGAPLWNRTLPAGAAFTTYSTLNSATLTQTVSAPGANSLVCLSCHDGQTAIDSIMNMPGSGRYSSTPNTAFLNTWAVGAGFPSGASRGANHSRLGNERALTGVDAIGLSQCLSCHQPGDNGDATATDFTAFVIGRNLTNDHPVGITFPTANPDFNAPTATQGSAKFFDEDADGHMDKNEVRVYDTGDGHEVECASCHDPHGVPSGGAGSTFIPTFMRVANSGGSVASGLCMTCHVK